MCIAARRLLAWKLDDLAHHSGVGRATVSRFESRSSDFRVSTDIVIKLRQTLERAGVEFVMSHGDGFASLANPAPVTEKAVEFSDGTVVRLRKPAPGT